MVVSVITHAFASSKNFNATYVMHKIQGTHTTQGTTSHNLDTGRSQEATAIRISMKSRHTRHCTHTTVIKAQKT